MRITDFDIYHDLLKEKSGLILTPDQSYLLDSRLAPIVKKMGIQQHGSYERRAARRAGQKAG